MGAALLARPGRDWCKHTPGRDRVEDCVGNRKGGFARKQASSGRPIPGACQPRRPLDWLAGPFREDAGWPRSGSRRRLRRPVARPPFSTPRLRGLLHPAALTVVLLTERLPAEHAALPVRGAAPRRGSLSSTRPRPAAARRAAEPLVARPRTGLLRGGDVVRRHGARRAPHRARLDEQLGVRAGRAG